MYEYGDGGEEIVRWLGRLPWSSGSWHWFSWGGSWCGRGSGGDEGESTGPLLGDVTTTTATQSTDMTDTESGDTTTTHRRERHRHDRHLRPTSPPRSPPPRGRPPSPIALGSSGI